MSLETILIIVVVVFLLGGGGLVLARARLTRLVLEPKHGSGVGSGM